MGKGILGVVAGLAVWMIVVSVAGLVLRVAWPEYVSAAGTMTFTASMKVARLSIGALATLAAGWVAALVARSTTAALVAGALLLVAFIPEHIMLWDKFPVWYHMTFLLSLVPLTYAGGRILLDSSVGFKAQRDATLTVRR
jgi:hypothetical protein